ncbi:hypothetical protein KJS94_09215 [Flavihumibacter rivuli]|uniref:hypothetical protein n=1 Tax=Flavihumibacter rivuli TaxID=2838156 RepID=UPI001BDE12F0|nr:hypothetical protein [Flavihumibacter rivuli]ULQ58374.1 hypothetical protein KJS94_09215 [Flavihumibacter rivuli]
MQNRERAARKNLSRSASNTKKKTPETKGEAVTKKVITATGKDWMEGLPAPAQRALTGAGITTLKKLSSFTAADLLALHGFGPSSIPKVRELLYAKGWKLKGD